MNDTDKTTEQLLGELGELRFRNAELESALKMLNSPESKYREMIEQVTDPVFVVQEGWIKFVNPACSKLTGYSMEEVLASGVIESLVHTDDREMVARYHARRLQGEATHFHYDFRIICKKGIQKWVGLNSSLIMWEGKPAALCVATDITARKEMENALRESEEKYRLIFNGSPVGINHFDSKGVVTECNQALLEIMGSTREKNIGFNVLASVKDAAVRGVFKSALSGRTGRYEGEYTSILGHKTSWLNIEYAPIMGIDGLVSGGIGIFQDITERKRSEEALRESELVHRTLCENIPGIVYRVELNEPVRMQFFNSTIHTITGFIEAELTVGQVCSIDPLIVEEDKARVVDVVKQALAEDKPFEVEYRIRHKSGSIRHLREYGRPIKSLTEEHSYIDGVIFDDTERKRMEEALKQSEKRYRELTEFLPQAVYEVDTTMKPTFVNPACVELSRYTSEELLSGFNPLTLVIPEDRARMAEDFQKMMQGQPIILSEYTGLRKDGTIVPVLGSAAPIYENEMVVGIRGVISDITALKRTEQEKMALQNQLFQSQKMESLGTLVGGIAHDFNNMLQIILGYCDILRTDKEEGDPGYNYIQTIIRTGEEGANLVKQLLAFGQQSQLLTVPLDLNHQIKEAYKLITRTLPQVVQIDMDLTEEPTTICADPNQIDQILMNLAINASEAMLNGGRLTIATKTLSSNDGPCLICNKPIIGNSVMLSVKDTGRGMDKETLSKIFDPFFSTKQRGSKRGTGLGLSVVQGVVQQQDGHICCQSEPGRGTEFRVYFRAIGAPVKTVTARESTAKTVGTGTILVVEDNVEVAEFEQQCLGSAGYKVIVANNGKEALEIYRTKTEEISLVILDLIMPEMSGRDCLMELVKIDPSVRVLIASGYTPEDDLHKELTPLVRGFVHKPFTITALQNEVQSVLSGK